MAPRDPILKANDKETMLFILLIVIFQVHYPESGLRCLSDQHSRLQLLADARPPVVAALGNGESGTLRPGRIRPGCNPIKAYLSLKRINCLKILDGWLFRFRFKYCLIILLIEVMHFQAISD